MKKRYRKLTVCLTVMALCLGLAACAKKPEFREVDITMDELEQKISDKETFKLLVERDNCPFCEQLNEYIEKTKDGHDVTVYKLDVTDFEFKREKEDSTTLISTSEDGKKFLEHFPYFMYTPTIYTINEGGAVQAAIGYDPENETMSQWDVNSPIDWDEAGAIGVWDYLQP